MRHFSVEWTDLKTEFRDEVIESVIETLMEEAKEEGKKFLKRDWHNPVPKTWEEAYCREYAITTCMWEEYVDYFGDSHIGDEVAPPPKEDWAYWVHEHLEEEADKLCYEAMHHLIIDVES